LVECPAERFGVGGASCAARSGPLVLQLLPDSFGRAPHSSPKKRTEILDVQRYVNLDRAEVCRVRHSRRPPSVRMLASVSVSIQMLWPGAMLRTLCVFRPCGRRSITGETRILCACQHSW